MGVDEDVSKPKSITKFKSQMFKNGAIVAIVLLFVIFAIILIIFIIKSINNKDSASGQGENMCFGNRDCQVGFHCEMNERSTTPGVCVPDGDKCNRVQYSNCGGEQFCSKKGEVATCACPDDPTQTVDANSVHEVPFCHEVPKNETATTAYVQAGGSQKDKQGGISLDEYIKWDYRNKVWTIRAQIRLRSQFPEWNVVNDGIPLYNTNRKIRSFTKYCVSDLQADENVVKFSKCGESQWCVEGVCNNESDDSFWSKLTSNLHWVFLEIESVILIIIGLLLMKRKFSNRRRTPVSPRSTIANMWKTLSDSTDFTEKYI